MYAFHHPPKNNWCGRGDLRAHAPKGAAVFETARSTVPRTAAGGRGGRSCTGTDRKGPAGFKSAVSAFQPRREKTGADGGSRTLMSFRPPAPRAGASPVPPRPHEKLDPARRLALRSSPYQGDASLPTLCRRKMVEAEGLAPPQPVKGGAFTARCNCCSATPRKIGGSGGIFTRIDTAYETVAPLLCYRARMVGRPGNAPGSAG